MTGPPGGRTLPQTATKLSDLVGGLYGPGASVASTGTNAYRPAIKAGVSRAAGETWQDILEYYLVRLYIAHVPYPKLTADGFSSTQTAARLTLHTASARFSIKGACTLLLEGLPLAPREWAPYRANTTSPVGTSWQLRRRSGLTIHRRMSRRRTTPTSRPGMPQRVQDTLGGCTSAVKV